MRLNTFAEQEMSGAGRAFKFRAQLLDRDTNIELHLSMCILLPERSTKRLKVLLNNQSDSIDESLERDICGSAMLDLTHGAFALKESEKGKAQGVFLFAQRRMSQIQSHAEGHSCFFSRK